SSSGIDELFAPTVSVEWTYLGTTRTITPVLLPETVTAVSAPSFQSGPGTIFVGGSTASFQVTTAPAAGDGTGLSFSASGLPSGVTLSPAGLLVEDGTTASGGYQAVLTATETLHGITKSTQQGFTVDVLAAAAPGTATVGFPVSGISAVSTPPSGCTFSAPAGLPTGLAMAADGTVSGRPADSGSSTSTTADVTVAASCGTASADLSWQLQLQPAIQISPDSLPGGTAGAPYQNSDGTPVTLQTSGIPAGASVAWTWVPAAGTSLPPGLTLAAVSSSPSGTSQATLSGTVTPDSVTATGPETFNFTVEVTSTDGAIVYASKSLSLTVLPVLPPPTTTTTTTPTTTTTTTPPTTTTSG
ncbi:MAG: hypothetical protein JWM85_1291, partial [Acidimicrobiaceae bacterium]|nr:hypothetical protein [Acidimicrobiaceae bacterium]